MNSLWLVITALAAFLVAYRLYGAFLAARVAVLNDKNITPANRLRDDIDYQPTRRLVLFGVHFAAIAGPGPLVGPVLASQWGYFPGFCWIVIGACLAGGVHDFVILLASVRNDGLSLPKIARDLLGPVSGVTTTLATLFIIIVTLAGVAKVVVYALSESSWGMFTIVVTIPAALVTGLWMNVIRKGRVGEATLIGVSIVLLGVIFGKPFDDSAWRDWLIFSKPQLSIMLPVYAAIASILPVWILLCPRDYLSSYMKIGVIALLAVGIFVAHPVLKMPATTPFIHGNGPVVPGTVWPFVCIVIMCGALSGFHALISSGTTPKMLARERDILPIGYGAMLLEGFVSVTALIAACALEPGDYFKINIEEKNYAAVMAGTQNTPGLDMAPKEFDQLEASTGEKSLAGKTGGAVTLAVGMAKVFSSLPGMKALMSYWYHFVIMFEALFILTLLETGTRVARFIFQETAQQFLPQRLAQRRDVNLGLNVVLSVLVCGLWGYLLYSGNIATLWRMMGIANQLLATIALAIGTTYLLTHAPRRAYAFCTGIPLVFVVATVFTAGIESIQSWRQELATLTAGSPEAFYLRLVSILAVIMLGLSGLVVLDSARRWVVLLALLQRNRLNWPERWLNVNWRNIFARKNLEGLLAEAEGEHRLHRVLGPWSLTALGVGCIIGAGIFVVTGRAAALDAGPGVILSYAIAGVGCTLAALCYAEFAAMAPVAGSAYTYAYTTLGEIFAWIIGWDLILEYAMGCATVASAWTNYFNEFLKALHWWQVPERLCNPPWTVDSSAPGIINLPAVLLVGLITVILVLGIRESARANTTLVVIKLVVVVFVIVLGVSYVKPSNWTSVPVSRRALPQEKKLIPDEVAKYAELVHKLKLASIDYPDLVTAEMKQRVDKLSAITEEREAELNTEVVAKYRSLRRTAEIEDLQNRGKLTPAKAKAEIDALAMSLADFQPKTSEEQSIVNDILTQIQGKKVSDAEAESWGLLGTFGINRWLTPIDDATRSPFIPFGFSGLMLGAAIVFFAFIGFDSISTHAEEARNPQRDVPFGILMSLCVCTVLYITVSAVITGMVPYPDIDIKAPIAAAFSHQPGADKSLFLRGATAIISAGGLAGMTSVLLVLFLSQARIFMAMSRDGLLPEVFGKVHPKFQTPHIATMVTGAFIAVTAGLTPIKTLHEMVNIGTLLAFVMVCAAVFILRFQRPSAVRPFRCPVIYIVAPLGILVNVLMMLFLPVDSWLRLVGWLVIGMVIYFAYSIRHSHLARHLLQEIRTPRKEITGTKFDAEVVE